MLCLDSVYLFSFQLDNHTDYLKKKKEPQDDYIST